MTAATSTFAIAHQIFVLDAHLQNPLDCSQQESITQAFVSDFLSVLALEPLGPLGIYPAVDDRAPGWSFIQPITTSHISAHYFEKPGRYPHIRIDAYSCDEIKWRQVIDVCCQHFQLSDWRATFIDREIDQQRPRLVSDIRGEGRSVAEYRLLQHQASVENNLTAA